MYAKSGEKSFDVSVMEDNATWRTISIENIKVIDNKVEIGFIADGRSGAFCLVDDVC